MSMDFIVEVRGRPYAGTIRWFLELQAGSYK
jgi:hypothetical protein